MAAMTSRSTKPRTPSTGHVGAGSVAIAEAAVASQAAASAAPGVMKRSAPDPHEPVLELLRSFKVKNRNGFYDRNIRGKMMHFDNSMRGRAKPPTVPTPCVGQRSGRNKQAQQSKEEWSHLKYADFQALRDLWAAHIEGFKPADGQALAKLLATSDLHGSTLKVVSAKNPGCVHLCGTVIEETQKTFRIITPDSAIKVLPKERCIFEICTRGEHVRLLGPAWVSRLPGGAPGPCTPKAWSLP